MTYTCECWLYTVITIYNNFFPELTGGKLNSNTLVI